MPRALGAPARLLGNDTRLRWWPSGNPRDGKPENRLLLPHEDPQKVLAAKLTELANIELTLAECALAHLRSIPAEPTRREYESRSRVWCMRSFLTPEGQALWDQDLLDMAEAARYSLPVSKFDSKMHNTILEAAVRNGATANTVDKLDAYLGSLATHMLMTKLTETNPLGDIRRPNTKAWKREAKRKNKGPRHITRPDRVPTGEEVEKWAIAVMARLGQIGFFAVIIYSATGLRFAELPALTIDDVDFDTEEITVSKQLTRHDGLVDCPKDEDHRTLRYWALANDALRAVVDAAREYDRPFYKMSKAQQAKAIKDGYVPGLLFRQPDNDNTIWYDTFNRELNLAAKDCGFGWSIKDLRCHYASYNLAPVEHGGFGWGIPTVQEWMGHSHPSMTLAHYFRTIRQMKLKVAESFGDIHPSKLVNGYADTDED